MKINKLNINNIGGISNLSINFNEQMNILCGPNSIGKTTILECIGHSFTALNTNVLKKKANSVYGNFSSTVGSHTKNFELKEFFPTKSDQVIGFHEFANKLISLKVHRTFNYLALDAVSKDIDKTAYVHSEAVNGTSINEVKNWFVNRFLYSGHDGSVSEVQLHNFNIAKSCFSIIDSNFSFSNVMASDNEIMIKTPTGDIFYEYLSSGFKSMISILFGIIKDIEFRFKETQIKVDEFDGIILIDELELHLHPIWQSKITKILVDVFPQAQFIATTHSPHIIQNANPDEIIALERNNEEVIQRELPNSEYGFKGWTIEEVLTDVMGMDDTRTHTYKDAISTFELAIEEENYAVAKENYEKLDRLLHPDNHMRKLLSFDLASIRVDSND